MDLISIEVPTHTATAARALAQRYRTADAARMAALQTAAAGRPQQRGELVTAAAAHHRERDKAGAELAAILAPILAPMPELDTPPGADAG